MKALNDNRTLFYLTLFSLFALLFVFNVKSFILVVLLFGLLFFLLSGANVIETIFVVFLFSIPFEKGLRGWAIQVVPPGPEIWAPGYSFYFGFSLKLIFAVALFLLIVFDKNYNFKQFLHSQWLILSFFALSLISTFLASDSNLAILGLIRIASVVWIFIAGRQLFKNRKIRGYFRKLLLAFLLFFGFVGTRQFLAQQPLGLFLEDVLAFRAFGFLTTEGESLFRVSGLSGHPTFFASFLSLLFPVGVGTGLFFIEKKRTKDIYFVLSVLTILAGLISILGTFSRSSWIALGVTFLFFVWRIYKSKKSIEFNLVASVIVPILATVLILSSLLISRLASAKYVWTLGSGRVRLDLINQAWLMIREFPVLGVGLNHFTQIMSMGDLPPELKGFMFPVHNTFLLFFAELGILAGILFLVFVIVSLYRTFGKSFNNWVNYGIWIGAFSFLINAQFHTLFNQDPTFDLLIVFLAYLSVL